MSADLVNYYKDILRGCPDEDIDFYLEDANMNLSSLEEYNEVYNAAFERYLKEGGENEN
jgi:hypothetical protein